MAIALVEEFGEEQSAAFNTTYDYTQTLNSTGNQLVLIYHTSGGGAGLNSITGNNTCTVHATFATGINDHYFAIAGCADITSAGSQDITFNFNASSANHIMRALEFSGGDTTTWFDTSTTGTGSGNPSISKSQTNANSLFVATAVSTGGEPSADTGWTDIAMANPFWWNHGVRKISTISGNETDQMTSSSSWEMLVATFNEDQGAAGGGGFPRSLLTPARRLIIPVPKLIGIT